LDAYTGETRSDETVDAGRSPPAPRVPGGAWMTLVALLGAGWGALLSYSAFYLTEDRPATARQVEALPSPEPLSPEAALSAMTGALRTASAEPPPAPAPSAGSLPAPLSVLPPRLVGSDPAGLSLPPPALPATALPVTSHPEPSRVAATAQALAAERSTEPAAPDAAEAAPEFVGTWGPNARACGARSLRRGYLPARLTVEGAKAGGTTCEFRDRRRSGQAWVVTASCRDGAHRWSSQVRLHVDGVRLTWSSAKGVSTYIRCPRAG